MVEKDIGWTRYEEDNGNVRFTKPVKEQAEPKEQVRYNLGTMRFDLQHADGSWTTYDLVRRGG